jgi:hypothetical protein
MTTDFPGFVKCYGYAHNHTGIPNRVDIDQRPEAVNNEWVIL